MLEAGVRIEFFTPATPNCSEQLKNQYPCSNVSVKVVVPKARHGLMPWQAGLVPNMYRHFYNTAYSAI